MKYFVLNEAGGVEAVCATALLAVVCVAWLPGRPSICDRQMGIIWQGDLLDATEDLDGLAARIEKEG